METQQKVVRKSPPPEVDCGFNPAGSRRTLIVDLTPPITEPDARFEYVKTESTEPQKI